MKNVGADAHIGPQTHTVATKRGDVGIAPYKRNPYHDERNDMIGIE